jgi:hypothetical protein
MDRSIVQGGDHSSPQRLQRLLDRGYPSTIERAQRAMVGDTTVTPRQIAACGRFKHRSRTSRPTGAHGRT